MVVLENLSMALGTTSLQPRFENPREILGDRLREGSIYRLLADEGDRLFPDDYFADLYTRSVRGRPTVPARVLATVMLLQAFEGLSDREAVDHLEVDLRWQAACGVDTGAEAFHSTVLVGRVNRAPRLNKIHSIFAICQHLNSFDLARIILARNCYSDSKISNRRAVLWMQYAGAVTGSAPGSVAPARRSGSDTN